MIAWGLLAVALLADAASSIFNLYAKFWWFDETLHFSSSFAITLVLALYAYGALLTGRRRHEVLLVLTITGLGVALGVLWEMIEWVFDLVEPGDVIRNKTDTMTDLVLDAAGGLSAGILSVRMLRKGRRPKLTLPL